MSLVVCNQGTRLTLEAILNKTAPQNLKLKLYVNDITPGVTTLETDFTEASFTGYAAITLAGGSWTTAEANPSTASYAEQTFASSANQAAQIVYGYYLVQASSGKLIAAERFSASITIQKNGDAALFTPAMTGASA